MLSATERSIRGRIGGLSAAAQHNPRDYTRKARKAFLATFDAQVDPEGILPMAERTRRAMAARKLHFARLALKSARARRRT